MSELYNKINRSKLIVNGYIPFGLAMAIMIIMPVYHWFIPPFLIFWAIYSLFRAGFWFEAINDLDQKSKFLYILFLIFFIWQLAGMLYSDNHRGGWRNIELHISFLIFPLIMLMPGPIIQKRSGLLLKAFAISTAAFLVFCYLFAVYRSCSIISGRLIFNPYLPENSWLNYFFALEFAIFQHTSYLSMFVILSIFISFEASFDNSLSLKYRIFWTISGLIMIVSVYFLSSRAGILTVIITLPLYFTFKLRHHRYKKYFRVLVIFVTAILILIAITNPRVNNYLKWKEEKKVTNIEVRNDRLTILEASVELLKENFLWGVGTGDIQDELNKIYIGNGYPLLAKVNTNTHNQYLEIIIENGLPGIIIFSLMFGTMFYIAYQEKNILYFMFLTVVIIAFFFETMLNRLAGITFYSFFSFILLLNSEYQDNHRINTE